MERESRDEAIVSGQVEGIPGQLPAKWTLEGQDLDVFVRALLTSPAPSAYLKAAVKRFRQREGELRAETDATIPVKNHPIE